MAIEKLTTEDQDYLESFTSLERLSMNGTGLKSLENFPNSEKLVRLELSENKLTGDQLQQLGKYGECLHTLKLASNKISNFADLKNLVTLTFNRVQKSLKALKNLDLENNEVTKTKDYKMQVFQMLP